jgi:hypothetical protein
MEMDSRQLHCECNQNVEQLHEIFRPPHGMVPSHKLFTKEDMPPLLQRELRAIAGLTWDSTMALTLSECLPQKIVLPYDHNIVVTCLISRAYRWCFETAFHTSGLDAQKLHNVWATIAEEGKYRTQYVHELNADGNQGNLRM